MAFGRAASTATTDWNAVAAWYAHADRKAERTLDYSKTSQGADAVANLRARAEAAITRTVRPLIVADGGDIQVVRWCDDRLVLRLVGTCAGCPGRPYTVARLIEPVLRDVLGATFEISLEPG